MWKSRYSDQQIALALQQVEHGATVGEVCRKPGISEQTFYRWNQMEHYALVVMTITALLMLWIAQVDLTRITFFTALLWIGILVVVPMEAVDSWLAHMGGNKEKARDGRRRVP